MKQTNKRTNKRLKNNNNNTSPLNPAKNKTKQIKSQFSYFLNNSF